MIALLACICASASNLQIPLLHFAAMFEFINKELGVAAEHFDALQAAVFAYQYQHNPVYRQFCDLVGGGNTDTGFKNVPPFLPIRFFKTHRVLASGCEPEMVFESSGTTGMEVSRHAVHRINLYQSSFTQAFELFYGSPANWCILGLLPSYLERAHSSLVFMVQRLIEKSGHPQSGFYLHNTDALAQQLQQLEAARQPTLLLGVTYALLDFAATYPMPLRYTTIMETGGMKGRREELVRPEVHRRLQTAFGVASIHSEYGMTELLSQAYSRGEGLFRCPPWMRVLVRDEDDPAAVFATGKGALNIIDLANVFSCSFIATDDVGEVYADGSFRVLGRLDNSDIRGCSLLAL